ncbi:MAG TPA: molybdopterin-guanine dinucleotide biosynthesis protein B [Burkholderiales bacterium]|nr:molybdopterin-guanine dinucleotide biosynthesis protein B [Burkholderiales bacterium]
MKIDELPLETLPLSRGRNLVSPRDAGRRAFGFTGQSGNGKTSLLEKVIEHLILDGFTISAIKHAHHGFDIDKPGKDSYRMREAGCNEVMLVGDQRWVLMREFRRQPEPDLGMLLSRMEPVDLVLVEGFRDSPIPKIEVFRSSLGKAPLWPNNATIVAVASDESLDIDLPLLDLNDPRQIADFVRRYVLA